MFNVWSRQDGSNLQLQSCRTPYFSYEIVDQLWANAETAKWPLHRFLSLMRIMEVTHYIDEEIDLDAQGDPPSECVLELRYERESIARRSNVSPDKVLLSIRRMTFFWAADGCDWRTVPTEAIAAYFVHVSVVVNDATGNRHRLAYILESVVGNPSVGRIDSDGSIRLEPLNRSLFLHCRSNFLTTVGRDRDARIFPLFGTFFSQQNRITHVCAHAALRIAANSCGYLIGGRKLTNELINDALGVTHLNPDSRIGTLGHADSDEIRRNRGLTRHDIATVLGNKLDLGVSLLDCKRMADLEFDNYAYPPMESGWPVLVGLEGVNLKSGKQVDHVLTVLGHTLDRLRWSPEARHGYGMLPRSKFMSAVEWTDHFVINDDGYGMHMTLQSDIVRNFIAPHRNASLHVMFVMALRPKSVIFEALDATSLSEDLVRNFCRELRNQVGRTWDQNRWFTRLAESRELVCRTLHTSLDAYIASILPSVGKFAPSVEQHLRSLPPTFWLTEFALPPLYVGNGQKLADVIVRDDHTTAGRTPEDVSKTEWEFAWIPGAAKFRNRGSALFAWPITEPIDMIRLQTPASGVLRANQP